MLSGATTFEISEIQEAETEGDQDVTMLHCVQDRWMEFLRTMVISFLPLSPA
jgi:hypothetical protein